MRRLLLSTNSPDKVREFTQILLGLPLKIVTPGSVGLRLDVEESGSTFAENAAIKALAYHRATGMMALSDDSGLEVDALGGAPGVFSARYEGLPDGEAKNDLILKRLEGVPWTERGCRYVCEIALVDETGVLHGCRGTLSGKVSMGQKGEGGFGFDPIFFLPSYGRTVAELSPEVKNRISHRGKAGRCARRVIEGLLVLPRG